VPYILGQCPHIDISLRHQLNILVDHKHNARLADFGLVSALNHATNAASHMTAGAGKGTVRSVVQETGSYLC
jgi:hypothetical protein